ATSSYQFFRDRHRTVAARAQGGRIYGAIDVRRHADAFQVCASPRPIGGNRNRTAISVQQREGFRASHSSRRPRTDQNRRFRLGRERGHHLCCAGGMLVNQNGHGSVKPLVAETLRLQQDGFVSQREARKKRQAFETIPRNSVEPWETLWIDLLPECLPRQTVPNWPAVRHQKTHQTKASQTAAGVPA